MLKKLEGMRLLAFISANFMLMNNEILMMSKLWPGKSGNTSPLTSKSCNLLF